MSAKGCDFACLVRETLRFRRLDIYILSPIDIYIPSPLSRQDIDILSPLSRSDIYILSTLCRSDIYMLSTLCISDLYNPSPLPRQEIYVSSPLCRPGRWEVVCLGTGLPDTTPTLRLSKTDVRQLTVLT